MDSEHIDRLKALPLEQRVPIIARAFSEELASKLGLPAASIDIEAPFSKIAPVLDNIPMRWNEILNPWVKGFLGLRHFHLYEASLTNSVGALAGYLAYELEPVPIPTDTLDNINTEWNWGWSPPSPYQGKAQVQGNTAFVLGAGRSGTSLFRDMLTCHADIYAPNELHLLNFDDMAQRRSEMQSLLQQWMDVGLIETFCDRFGMTKMEAIITVKQLADESMPVNQVYELIQSQISGQWLIDKTPAYAQHPVWLARAEQMFACPRYLFMTRHPYAVMDSFIRSRFYRYSGNIWGAYSNNPWHCAEQYWATMNGNILDFLKSVPSSRRMRVSYEDLMQDTGKTQQAVCQFLSIPFDGNILDPYQQPGHSVAGNLRERNRVEHANAETWKDKCPPHRLSQRTKQVAEELGYPLP